MSFSRVGFLLSLCFAGFGTPGQTAELPKSLPPHPRILFKRDDLAGIKQRAAGQCQTHFESLKQQADDWLRREVKLPDRGGQWFHWYSCPKHGARLRTEGTTRHVCPVDQEVFSGYPYDDVVISTEHNRLAGAVRTLGIVYQVTGEARYAAKAKEILLAYAEKYQSYPLHDIHGQAKVGGGKVGPQTLDESTWLITVVEGADCIWGELTSAERQKLTEGLLLPATDVIRQHKMGIHNIQCWKNSAVGLTGLLLGDMKLVEEALGGSAGYYSQMAKGVSADGPWFEGAWGYHFYTLSAVLHLTEGAFNSGIHLYGPELKRMFDAPLAMVMPDLKLPAFNDSQTVDLVGSVGLYQTAFARYKDPRYLVVTARNTRGTDAALLHSLPESGPAMAFEPVSRNFVASGNAILAAGAGSDATWLCMKYGPHGGGHGHPDKLNFVLYGLAEVIAPDPGAANYGVPIQAGWFRTTLAHNTITVDEKSQKPAEGSCEAFISTNGFSAVMAEAGKICDGVKFYRTVALLGTNLVLFLDQLQSNEPHTYDLAYHSRGRVSALSDATGFELPNKLGYSYLRDTKAVVTYSAAQLQFDLGSERHSRWICAGGELTTVITGTGVGSHTEDRVPLIIARRQCRATTYLWCISLDGSDQPLELQPQAVSLSGGSRPEPASVAAVRVKTSLGVRILVANPTGKTAVFGPWQVQGRIALLSEDREGVIRVKYATR